MKKRLKRKLYKKRIVELANDGREFKSEQAKIAWIRDTYHGYGTAFTKYYIKGFPDPPYPWMKTV